MKLDKGIRRGDCENPLFSRLLENFIKKPQLLMGGYEILWFKSKFKKRDASAEASLFLNYGEIAYCFRYTSDKAYKDARDCVLSGYKGGKGLRRILHRGDV